MANADSPKSTPGLLLRGLLSLVSPAWISLLLKLYQALHAALAREQGMYEILAYDSTLELLDAGGKAARFKRHQKVKFLQDNIIVFQDHAWGAGNIFADYKVSRGIAVDRYQEGDRWNVLISLRETKSKGDIEDFYFERTAQNGFTKKEEWWQVAVWYKTRWLRMTALFPKGRHCQRAVLQTRGDNKTRVLGHEHLQVLPDGRQMLRWETRHSRYPEVYTIRWIW